MRPMATIMSLEEVGETLASRLRGRRSGAVEVRDVEVAVTEDRDGVAAVNLTAVLADPAPGTDTWPLETLLPLRRDVLKHANELGLESPVYLWFKAVSDPPQDDEA